MLRSVGMVALVAAAIVSATVAAPRVRAQSARPAPPSQTRIPEEAAGIDGVAAALMSVYARFDVLALGEAHERRIDSDVRIALVRHPDFARKVRTIVVEFATTAEQATLDRYIRGENVSRAQLDRVRPRQPGSLTSAHGVYADFFSAVRDVNAKLPADSRIRVFGGEDDRNRDTAAIAILEAQALRSGGKALVIYGHGHFWRASPTPPGVPGDPPDFGIVKMLERRYPGRTFAVLPVGGPGTAASAAAYQRFDGALKSRTRPVLVPLQRPPFRDFVAGDYLDFVEAQELWTDPDRLEIPARSLDEPRFQVIGRIGETTWSAFVTYRHGKTRIISVRRARADEEARYLAD